MSSPVKKRTALVGKNVNLKQNAGSIHKSNHSSNHSSPSKRSQKDLSYALRHSPVRTVSLSPKRSNSSSAAFTIHEETQTERTATLMTHMSLSKHANLNHDENDFSAIKENMSPSKLTTAKYMGRPQTPLRSQSQGRRLPLRDLCIKEHKGYIEDPRSAEITQLTLHCTRKMQLPNFVTPPRDKKLQQFFTSRRSGENEELGGHLYTSRSCDDISKDKIIKKLNFKICEN